MGGKQQGAWTYLCGAGRRREASLAFFDVLRMKTAILVALALAPAVAGSNFWGVGDMKAAKSKVGVSQFCNRVDLSPCTAGRDCTFAFCGPAGASLASAHSGKFCPPPRVTTGEALFALPSHRDMSFGGARHGVSSLHASSVVKKDVSVMPSPEQLGLKIMDQSALSSLPFLENEISKAYQESVDTVLKGVQVGHGIRYSVHPKTVVASERSHLAKAVQKIHDAGLCAVEGDGCQTNLHFTVGQIEKVREEVNEHHRLSERKLSAIGQLLIERFTLGSYQTSSLVTAQVSSTGEVFTLTQSLSKQELSAGGADSAKLAANQLHGLSVETRPGLGVNPEMVDHSVEFQADEWNEAGVHRVIAHARPRHDLWKVIADSLFGLEDSLPDVAVDEEMYHLKIVVEDAEHAERLHRSLRNLEWSDSELRQLGIPVEAATRRIELIEQSTHTAQDLGHMISLNGGVESSGDRSSVLSWWNAGMQIRVQTLNEHYAETEMISMANRERLSTRKQLQRGHLAAQNPLYGFTRNIMEWMLTSDDFRVSSPPSMAQIKVNIDN